MKTLAAICRVLFAAIIVAAPLAIPVAAHACGVCFGEPDSPQTHGMNAAIGMLMIVVIGAGAALVGLIRAAGSPLPPEVTLPPEIALPPHVPPQGDA